MLNFRKLRQDFSSNILKEGKELFDKGCVSSAKILQLDGNSLKVAARVKRNTETIYESEIEIDRVESMAIDSNCDCTYTYDCQHIAAVLFYCEEHLNQMVVAYSKEANLDQCEKIDADVKKELKETFIAAQTKESKRKDLEKQKEILLEYVEAAKELGRSPFFHPLEVNEEDRADLGAIFSLPEEGKNSCELFLALRLPFRSKPLYIQNIKAFLDALRYREPIHLAGRKCLFTLNSFEPICRELVTGLLNHARVYIGTDERLARFAQIDLETWGGILAKIYELNLAKNPPLGLARDKEPQPLPHLYIGNIEEPLCYSTCPAQLRFALEYLEAPHPTLLLKPSIVGDEEQISPNEVLLFEANRPGLIHKNTYYHFSPKIKRAHLRNLHTLSNIAIPEPLFGTFIENGLPSLKQYATVTNLKAISSITTLPFPKELKGRCQINYLNGELEARLFFLYDQIEVPAATGALEFKHLNAFMGKMGITARNLVEERQMTEELFQDFLYDEKEGVYRIKSEKKIVEFMTEEIPKNQHRIKFECPENLSEQFIYDETSFELTCRESKRVDVYEVSLKVNGFLKGISLDRLWDCVVSKKRFLELEKGTGKEKKAKVRVPRILVLDLEKISPLVQLFDEIGIKKLDDHVEERPLWSLTNIHPEQFKNLPVAFAMTPRLKQIQEQIMGGSPMETQEIPSGIQATLRNYQLEGVHWLERLRNMHLSGILADDMGLGKTLQAIIAVTQSKCKKPATPSLVVCPTSLVYNWKEEFHKFNPNLKVQVVDSHPGQRHRLLKEIQKYDVLVTSYNLLQKDVEQYRKIPFDYVILDEAQHIKNRGTRNAKSVKMIQGAHRLILTGTPIENSLDELWSLFDFLMPGLLSSYDRFVEKYMRSHVQTPSSGTNMETLRRKVSPFILRRMKEDVLDDLPPVTDILYHCHLTDTQKELYNSYAASAKEELSKLVKKEGFDKIHIHVLATLTRLKQICCHPAIFAKETPEEGDSAKYDLLMELLPSLIEGKHKAVIFSQYTQMLKILRDDLVRKGIPFSYLDGSCKNRLQIVNDFNNDPSIPLFLVSLKAGGSGLNLVGADTVIHYDMWWNPAVENQATDRVHRLGQKKSVSSYKLITLNTIEEKILNLQNRKKGLVKKVISSDDEAISRLTWEEVLELLQT